MAKEPLPYSKKLTPFARHLRKTMTGAEVRIWSRLRLKQIKGYQFYRQKPVGNYIVDFYCPKGKLVIEIDGDSHFTGDSLHKDSIRDKYMSDQGFRVLRFTNYDVMKNLDGIIEKIESELK